jgi:protein-S-isoprenylcysteine O-methyltransferase Ste14
MIALKVHLWVFILLTLMLLGTAHAVFRLIVRREYLLRGQLTWMTSMLQLLAIAGLMCFPYLFNPPEWAWFWVSAGPASPQQYLIGLIIILLGFVMAFGTMAWFGLRRAFGVETQGLITTGPYRVTRNPQILGWYLLVIGVALQWHSWFAVVWIVLCGLVGHWMILAEEEHLQRILGKAYKSYCEQVPRYLFSVRKSRNESK